MNAEAEHALSDAFRFIEVIAAVLSAGDPS